MGEGWTKKPTNPKIKQWLELKRENIGSLCKILEIWPWSVGPVLIHLSGWLGFFCISFKLKLSFMPPTVSSSVCRVHFSVLFISTASLPFSDPPLISFSVFSKSVYFVNSNWCVSLSSLSSFSPLCLMFCGTFLSISLFCSS